MQLAVYTHLDLKTLKNSILILPSEVQKPHHLSPPYHNPHTRSPIYIYIHELTVTAKQLAFP
jgi:hypothetical protein